MDPVRLAEGDKLLDFLSKNIANLSASLGAAERQRASNLANYVANLKGQYTPDRMARELFPTLKRQIKTMPGPLRQAMTGALANTQGQMRMTVEVGQPIMSRPDSAMMGQKPAPQMGRGGTRAVQKWQMAYNARHGYKPGDDGWLSPDGLWGEETARAHAGEQYQRSQQAQQGVPELALEPIVRTPEPPAPPPPPVMPPPEPPPLLRMPLTWEEQKARTDEQLSRKRQELQDVMQKRLHLAPPTMPTGARVGPVRR